MISLDLEIDYPDSDTAKAVMEALGPDNEGYVETEVQGTKLLFTLSAETAGTMKNTCDDLMACIKTAEEAIGVSHDQS